MQEQMRIRPASDDLLFDPRTVEEGVANIFSIKAAKTDTPDIIRVQSELSFASSFADSLLKEGIPTYYNRMQQRWASLRQQEAALKEQMDAGNKANEGIIEKSKTIRQEKEVAYTQFVQSIPVLVKGQDNFATALGVDVKFGLFGKKTVTMSFAPQSSNAYSQLDSRIDRYLNSSMRSSEEIQAQVESMLFAGTSKFAELWTSLTKHNKFDENKERNSTGYRFWEKLYKLQADANYKDLNANDTKQLYKALTLFHLNLTLKPAGLLKHSNWYGIENPSYEEFMGMGINFTGEGFETFIDTYLKEKQAFLAVPKEVSGNQTSADLSGFETQIADIQAQIAQVETKPVRTAIGKTFNGMKRSIADILNKFGQVPENFDLLFNFLAKRNLFSDFVDEAGAITTTSLQNTLAEVFESAKAYLNTKSVAGNDPDTKLTGYLALLFNNKYEENTAREKKLLAALSLVQIIWNHSGALSDGASPQEAFKRNLTLAPFRLLDKEIKQAFPNR